MINPDNRLFCRLDGLTVSTREQQRMLAIEKLGLIEPESVPVFEEAVQTAAHFLNAPICILALMEQEYQKFKSAVGLSRLGLMNELATSRQFPRTESFCTHVVDSHQVLVVEDALSHPMLASSSLSYRYGIRAYLGIPLITSNGLCVGTLAVMDLVPRQFTSRDFEFLELTTRWVMSEFERKQSSSHKLVEQSEPRDSPQAANVSVADQLKVQLLSQLTQELRTPLTSVMGMASILTREIYGPLTSKQKEYLTIIHNSGQYLLSLVNEILELSDLSHCNQTLNLASVDIEMLCQQAINTLEQAAHRREQQIRLSVEPGHRIWLLDKEKIRQMLYHLIFSVMQFSNAGSTVRLHISFRVNTLNIAVWVSHPWLGEGLPYAEMYSNLLSAGAGANVGEGISEDNRALYNSDTSDFSGWNARLTAVEEEIERTALGKAALNSSESMNQNLGLLLSQYLAEVHGGRLSIQGTLDSGYRYLISLPQMAEVDEL
jgi:signal transduction histidine kinase